MKDTVVAIPASQSESFFSLLTAKFTALWTPIKRLHVTNGSSYTVGEFTIRVGELRQMGGPQTNRGILCCIETSSAAESEDKNNAGEQLQMVEQRQKEEETTKTAMTSLGTRVGFEGAKIPLFAATSNDGFDEARLWCDLLRLRA